MKKKGLWIACCALLLSGVEALACTGLLVGKKASVDGSVMISYAADSHGLYGEMYHWPAAIWPKGATLDVAVASAKDYLYHAIASGADYTIGKGHGPVNHFHALWH